jgi:hypothetical protein
VFTGASQKKAPPCSGAHSGQALQRVQGIAPRRRLTIESAADRMAYGDAEAAGVEAEGVSLGLGKTGGEHVGTC